tara:strand:- start:1014 stop:1433 length:420 start_codon:yes stop_codon:yes gene_type:complete
MVLYDKDHHDQTTDAIEKTETLSASISDSEMNNLTTTAGAESATETVIRGMFTIMGILVVFGQIKYDDDGPVGVDFLSNGSNAFSSIPIVLTTRVGDGSDDTGEEFYPKGMTRAKFFLNRPSSYNNASVINWIALGKKN